MTLQRPAALIFDWDGTLVDSLELLYQAHNHVRILMGLKAWSREEARAQIRASAREAYPRIYEGRSEDALKALYEFVEHNHLDMIEPMQGCLALLDGLSQNTHIPMAIISNKKQIYLEREVAHFGLTDHFLSIIGAGTAQRDKPARDPADIVFNIFASHHEQEIERKDVWFVGDTQTDIDCARAAGMTSIYIQHGLGGEAVLKNENSILSVKNLVECAQLIYGE